MFLRLSVFAITTFLMLQASAAEVLIYDFSRGKQYKVVPAYIKSKSKDRGFHYTAKTPARLWYKSSAERDIFSWAVKKLDIKGFDKLILRYKANKDTYVTIDLWYDGKMVAPRLVSYVKGTGEWTDLVLPVRGKKLKMAISISETKNQGAEAPGVVREIYLKGLWGVNSEPEKPEAIKTSANIVIPQPKEESYTKKKIYLSKEKLQLLYSDIASETATAALDSITENFENKTGLTLNKKQLITSQGKTTLIVLDIGGKNNIVKTLKVGIPEKPEGYAIKTGEYKGKNVIVIAGHDVPGLFWGLYTIFQLIHKDTKGVFIPECAIRDWPGFPYRSMSGGSIKKIKKNMAVKINVHFAAAWDPKIKGKWDNPPEVYRSSIKEMIDFCRPRGININQWVEPYDRKSKNNIICSNSDQVNAFYNTFKIGLESGNRVITIGLDDQAREKDSLAEKDLKKFGSDIKTHAWLIAEIAKRVNRDYPGTTICVIPKTYQSGRAVDVKGYYDKAGVPKNVVVMWTGESTVTLSYPDYKVKTFEKSIEDRRFVIFDNTFCQTLGEGRSLTLFETFAAGYKSLGKSDKCIGFHAMAGLNRSELRRIKALQIADYLWNPKRFDPKRSRSRTIAKVASNKAIAPLLKFRYYMMKLASLFPIEKPIEKLKKDFIERSSISTQEFKNYMAILNHADGALNEAQKTTSNTALIKELKNLLNNSKRVLQVLAKAEKKLKQIKTEGKASLDIVKNIRGGKVFKLYNHKCPPKTGIAIYGSKVKGKNLMTLEFAINKKPLNDVILNLEGQDDDKSGTTKIEISFNGNVIFKDKNPFVENGWSQKTFSIKKEFFNAGKNKLTIENLEDSDSFASRWFMLSKLELSF